MKRIALLLIAVAAGFGAGRWFAGPAGVMVGKAGAFASAGHPAPGSAAPSEMGAFASAEDAAGALFSAQQHPNRLRRGYELHRVFQRLDAAQFKALADRVIELGSGEASALLQPLLACWVALDPDGAAAWARPFIERVFVGTEGVDSAVFDAWAAADPEAAMTLALSRPFAEGSRRLIGKAVRALMGDRPEAQVQRLADLPAGELRDSALAVCLNEWAKSSPAEALARIDLLAPGAVLEKLRRDVLVAWAGEDFPAALTALSASLSTAEPSEDIRKTVQGVAYCVLQGDPERGCALLLNLPEAHRADALRAGVRAWAYRDAGRALEWGLRNGVPLEKNVDRSMSRSPIFQAMMTDSKATLAFVQSLPPGPERDRLLTAAVRSSQGGNARELLGELPAVEQPGAAHQLASLLHSKDADGAFAWVQTLPPGATREAAIRGLFSWDGSPTPPREVSLIENLPSARDRDVAFGSEAERCLFVSPARAFEFAGRIVDPALRETTHRRIAGGWISSQPTAAEAWLATTNEISPASKAILQRRLEESRGER